MVGGEGLIEIGTKSLSLLFFLKSSLRHLVSDNAPFFMEMGLNPSPFPNFITKSNIHNDLVWYPQPSPSIIYSLTSTTKNYSKNYRSNSVKKFYDNQSRRCRMWKLSPDRAAAGTRSSPSTSCLESSVSDSVVSCLSVHNIQSPVHPHQIKTRLYSLSSLPHRKCLKSEICSCFKMGVIFDSKNFLIVQFCSCNKICQVTHC